MRLRPPLDKNGRRVGVGRLQLVDHRMRKLMAIFAQPIWMICGFPVGRTARTAQSEAANRHPSLPEQLAANPINLRAQRATSHRLQLGDVPVHRFQVALPVGHTIIVEHDEPLRFHSVRIGILRL
jgi:hypothetical protein